MNTRKLQILILSILSVIIIIVGVILFVRPMNKTSNISFSNYKYENANLYTQSSAGSEKNISNLEINWVSGSVEIVPYNGNEVKFEEYCKTGIPEEYKMCYWKDRDTLKIQFTSSGTHKIINNEKQLTVYIPDKLELDDLDIEVVSADVRIENLNSRETSIDGVSGDCFIKSFNTLEMEYNTVSGNLFADNVGFVSFEGDTTSGDISINLSSILKTKEIKADTVSGDIELILPEDSGFTLSLKTISGDIKCETETKMPSKKTLVHGDGFLKIDLDTVSGDVTLR